MSNIRLIRLVPVLAIQAESNFEIHCNHQRCKDGSCMLLPVAVGRHSPSKVYLIYQLCKLWNLQARCSVAHVIKF